MATKETTPADETSFPDNVSYYNRYVQELNDVLQAADPLVLKVCKRLIPKFGEPQHGSVTYVKMKLNEVALVLQTVDKVKREEENESERSLRDAFDKVWED